MAYTNIDDPSAYFQIKTYTGNRAGGHAITNDGNSDLQPDLIWNKSSSYASYHTWWDSSRGSSKYIGSNATDAEGTYTGYLSSFDSDGFTLGGGDSRVNYTHEYVAWQWKANGGTTASNSNGSITSTVQANTDAGFSIVTYTGNGTVANASTTVGHGLSQRPDAIIIKDRDDAVNWNAWFESFTAGQVIYPNLTNGRNADTNVWANTLPTSSVFCVGNSEVNANNKKHVAYCFHSVQGYSKFGSYVGNGNTNGAFIYTGFRPAFIMTKKSSAAGGGWFMQDIKRGIKNNDTNTPVLQANDAYSEADIGTTDYEIDFLSNGFKLRDDNTYVNLSGTTYIYMAFAENPFVTSTGIPTTAR